MKEELIGGLKNAIERGASIESAINSMINAGYKKEEVLQAAKEFSSGVSHFLPQNNSTSIPTQNSTTPQKQISQGNDIPKPSKQAIPVQQQVSTQQNNFQQIKTTSSFFSSPDSGKKLVVIGLIVLLLIFLITIGVILYIK